MASLLLVLVGVIEGTVHDSLGAPVAGATVAAVNYELTVDRSDGAVLAQTGADGSFRLQSLAPGEYGVTATVLGATAAYQGHVRPGTEVNLVVGIGAGRTLLGVVRDATGSAAADAEVSAIRVSSE